jgi:hypothetical protein
MKFLSHYTFITFIMLPLSLLLILSGNIWATQYEQALVCTDSRTIVLALTNARPGGKGTTTLGVLIEMGSKQSFAKLVSSNDGATNLYYTSSMKLIGTGGPMFLKDAVAGLVEFTQDSTKGMDLVATNLSPEPNRVDFYILNSSGVFRTHNAVKYLVNSSNGLANLYTEARGVLDLAYYIMLP